MILLDLDDFKQINDRFGHDVGDEALKLIGELVRASIRSTDLGVRFGGDEIAIVLPSADLSVAQRIAKRLKVSLEDERRCLADLELTISQGIAPAEAGEKLADAVRRADEALRSAKLKGRGIIQAAPHDRSVAANAPATVCGNDNEQSSRASV